MENSIEKSKVDLQGKIPELLSVTLRVVRPIINRANHIDEKH